MGWRSGTSLWVTASLLRHSLRAAWEDFSCTFYRGLSSVMIGSGYVLCFWLQSGLSYWSMNMSAVPWSWRHILRVLKWLIFRYSTARPFHFVLTYLVRCLYLISKDSIFLMTADGICTSSLGRLSLPFKFRAWRISSVVSLGTRPLSFTVVFIRFLRCFHKDKVEI